MMRWPSVVDRGALTLVAVLCVAAAAPLAAQQASGPAPQGRAGAVHASPPSASLPGPRLRPEWRRVEPSFAGGSAQDAVTVSDRKTTITVTTVVLVLAVAIIVVLLVT